MTRNTVPKDKTESNTKATEKQVETNEKGKKILKKKTTKKVNKKESVLKKQTKTQEQQETPSEISTTPGGTRKRREVNAETVDASFTDLCSKLQNEIEKQRELKENTKSGNKAVNIKFLRSTLKNLKQLQNDTRRVARKKRTTRQGNNNSGFMKPAVVSDEMADFLAVDHGTKMSRVECTKRLHEYIKEHDLQNKENRREIKPDNALSKLLHYDNRSVVDGGHGPLYYYIMQKLIQQHFVKETPMETPAP